MATKAKPKSNRAKFTIGKKTEKPKEKAEVEAPKKEKKIEIVEKPQVEAEESSQEEIPVSTIEEKHQEEVISPSITHQPEVVQPEVEEQPHEQPHEQTPNLPTNPFTISTPTMPEHPAEPHENPFTQATSIPTEEHPSEPLAEQSIQHSPLENAELSSTLPKEDNPHQSSFSTPVEVETNNKGKGIIIYFIIVAFIAFLIGIGSMALFTFGLNKTNGGMPHVSLLHFMAKASPTPVKTKNIATPTPAPTKAVDLSSYNIKILNGSGITGAASKLKTELTTDGFTVISTGNADKNSYTDTIISSKKDINSEYVNKLKEILKKDYNLGQDTQLSDADAKQEDVTITIGSTTAK